jgi:hypothetical protein
MTRRELGLASNAPPSLDQASAPADAALGGFELDPFDPSVARLERYQAVTNVEPPADLVSDVDAWVAREPVSTPVRRFFSAARASDGRSTLRAIRQSLAIALGARTARPVVRAQAAVLVLVVLVSSGFSGVAAFAGAGAGIELVKSVAFETTKPPASEGADARAKPKAVTTSRGRDAGARSVAPMPASKTKPRSGAKDDHKSDESKAGGETGPGVVGLPRDDDASRTPKDKQPKDKQPKDKQPKDKQPKDKQPKDKQPKDKQPKDKQPKD